MTAWWTPGALIDNSEQEPCPECGFVSMWLECGVEVAVSVCCGAEI